MRFPLRLHCDEEKQYVRVKDLREEKKILFLILYPMQNSRCLLNQTWENVTMGDNDTASAGVDNMNKFDFPQDDIQSDDGCEYRKTGGFPWIHISFELSPKAGFIFPLVMMIYMKMTIRPEKTFLFFDTCTPLDDVTPWCYTRTEVLNIIMIMININSIMIMIIILINKHHPQCIYNKVNLSYILGHWGYCSPECSGEESLANSICFIYHDG